MRWFLLVVIFVFIWGGVEVYCRTALVRNSYAIQKFENEIEKVEKENGSLKRKISSHLSLRKLESYARKELNLVEPEAVRYIRKESGGEQKEAFPFWVKTWNWIREYLEVWESD